ncbi:ATP-grasp fold amidoligase family protein [Oceanobacillus caeni]|uniref:ATP-grasp fold amidoligase family protein n=1 Tax=Oceanobacillus caeni TaxID=405946 RepID=UPI002E1A946B|nr:hypothetical protein [Oceanobacillus caeni]
MQESEQLEKQFEHEMEKEYSFLRTLMEIELKIENLDQKVKKNVKEKRNIKKSHSWRYSKPLRMFHASENHYNLDLQADIYHLKEELRYLSLQIERQDPEQMFGYLKEAKKSGEIFQHLESLLKQKLESDTFYSAIFKYIASLYKNEKAEYRDLVYNKLLSGMSTDHVPEMIVRAGEGCDSLSLKQVASFQTSLNLRARRGQLGDSLPEKLLDKKEVAYRFVDKLGVRRPWTGNDTFPSDKIPKKKGIVIKPHV